MTGKLDERQQRNAATMALLKSMGQLADELMAIVRQHRALMKELGP